VLITALAIFALNIVIDLGYALLDPRVRPTSTSRARRKGPGTISDTKAEVLTNV
jgi:peptide/nickel transport system permease protein